MESIGLQDQVKNNLVEIANFGRYKILIFGPKIENMPISSYDSSFLFVRTPEIQNKIFR